MNVLLIQVDGKFPNLALLKLSTFYKDQGEKVFFGNAPDCRDPDIVCVSCIYDWNRETALGIGRMFTKAHVYYGGSGIDLEQSLPDGVEILKPDYQLLNMDYSLGFTSRGCIRRCPFCIVPTKEGRIHDHTPIQMFHDPSHEKIILLDNNILAAPSCHRTFDYLIENDLKVAFTQGLDIRLMDEDFAKKLSLIKYYNWHFGRRQIHFAWDQMQGEYLVRKNLEMFLDAGNKADNIMFYVLTNFDTTIEDDMYRVKTLWEDFKVVSHIMVYDRMNADLRRRRFARWVNRKWLFKSTSFDDFLSTFQDYKKPLDKAQTTLGDGYAR